MADDPGKRVVGARAGALAAIVVAAVLVSIGLWIAQSLIGMVHQQNCAMSGRRDCLAVPSR